MRSSKLLVAQLIALAVAVGALLIAFDGIVRLCEQPPASRNTDRISVVRANPVVDR